VCNCSQESRRDAHRNHNIGIFEEVDLDELMDDDQRRAKSLPPQQSHSGVYATWLAAMLVLQMY
jgi:hypothetical protein